MIHKHKSPSRKLLLELVCVIFSIAVLLGIYFIFWMLIMYKPGFVLNLNTNTWEAYENTEDDYTIKYPVKFLLGFSNKKDWFVVEKFFNLPEKCPMITWQGWVEEKYKSSYILTPCQKGRKISEMSLWGKIDQAWDDHPAEYLRITVWENSDNFSVKKWFQNYACVEKHSFHHDFSPTGLDCKFDYFEEFPHETISSNVDDIIEKFKDSIISGQPAVKWQDFKNNENFFIAQNNRLYVIQTFHESHLTSKKLKRKVVNKMLSTFKFLSGINK